MVTAKVLFLRLCFWEESLSSWLLELAITTGILNKTMSLPNKITTDLLTLHEENTSSPTDTAARGGRNHPSLLLWMDEALAMIRSTSSRALIYPNTASTACTCNRPRCVLLSQRKNTQILQRRSQSNKKQNQGFFWKTNNKSNPFSLGYSHITTGMCY